MAHGELHEIGPRKLPCNFSCFEYHENYSQNYFPNESAGFIEQRHCAQKGLYFKHSIL